jgi:hypothetical protein
MASPADDVDMGVRRSSSLIARAAAMLSAVVAAGSCGGGGSSDDGDAPDRHGRSARLGNAADRVDRLLTG